MNAALHRCMILLMARKKSRLHSGNDYRRETRDDRLAASSQAERSEDIDMDRVGKILKSARDLAIDYYRETGKPLGITAEVAEFEAATLLGLALCGARQRGFDAYSSRGRRRKRIQIKGRRLDDVRDKSPLLGSIKLDRNWDSVMLVLLNSAFEAVEIWEANRPAIAKALNVPGSKARNERGQLSIGKFKSIGKLVWGGEEKVGSP